MQHIEFLHKDHFENKYHRKWLRQEQLASFIDFFWETDFDDLWAQYPDGFSDILFPNTGYTYLINLGTPFVMQLGNDPFEMKSDGFLPRHKSLACHHAAGNKIFGIKFKISPLVFEKKINFAEYREYIFPLSYLIDRFIADGLAKDEALQKARLEFYSDADAAQRYPYYWAAPLLTGSTEPLAQKKQVWPLWAGLLLVLAVAVFFFLRKRRSL